MRRHKDCFKANSYLLTFTQLCEQGIVRPHAESLQLYNQGTICCPPQCVELSSKADHLHRGRSQYFHGNLANRWNEALTDFTKASTTCQR